jgi:hypothetical protein
MLQLEHDPLVSVLSDYLMKPTLEADKIIQLVFDMRDEHGDASNCLNNIWMHIRGGHKLPVLKHSVWKLIGKPEPIPAKEGSAKCAGGKHIEHTCACYEVEGCGCIIDRDEMRVCEGCECCGDCCDEAGNCFRCDQCKQWVCTNDSSQCNCCEYCQECCSNNGECYYCESCECTKSSSCSNCEQCDNCCQCWNCGYCDSKFLEDSEVSFCCDCDRCENCCKCVHCSDCGKKNPHTGTCIECNNCGDCCGCEDGFKRAYRCTYCNKRVTDRCVACSRCSGCCRCANGYAFLNVHTQKVKGVKALASLVGNPYGTPVFSVLSSDKAKAQAHTMLGKFVRPCPKDARHGFVDSRVVADEAAALALIDETLAVDSEAEFIVMSKIAATHNGVWTPGLVVIGPSNDGATAGHDCITLPIGGTFLTCPANSVVLLIAAGIKDAPYVEMLWSDGGIGRGGTKGHPKFNTVQLRNGPKVPQQVDYIAEQTVITGVILAEGDLLEWENKMKNQPAGTVVYHPGGSLASHYAVHAMLNHIPVLISHEPKVGDILFPISGNEASKPNMADMRTGFYYGMTADIDHITATYMMLLGCHSTVRWLGKHDLLLGMALGCCYRLSITAALGEWRYRVGVDDPDGSKPLGSRDSIYVKVWPHIKRMRGLFLHALRDFRQLPWKASVGGEPWFEFTHWAAVIFNAVRKGDAATALEAMNKAVNASHNNGWGFNKFAGQDAMDSVARNPVTAIRWVGPLLHEAIAVQAKYKKAAKDWFRKRKPYPTNKMNKWLDIPVPFDKALKAQVRLDKDSLIVECKAGFNTLVYQTHVLPIPTDKQEIVAKLFAQNEADGRITLHSYDGNKKGHDYPRFIELVKTTAAIEQAYAPVWTMTSYVLDPLKWSKKLARVNIPIEPQKEMIYVQQ